MKRNNLQTKTWQSVGLLQWHQLCTTQIENKRHTLTAKFLCLSPNMEKSWCYLWDRVKHPIDHWTYTLACKLMWESILHGLDHTPENQGKQYKQKEWSDEVGVGQLKRNLTIYDDSSVKGRHRKYMATCSLSYVYRSIHELRYAENAGQEIFNVTHKLSVKGKDMMRLHFTKSAMSLTSCLT